MRNWAAYATAAREHARLERSALADQIGVSYATIWRWETGKQSPENADVVGRFVEVTGVNLNEALAAAGLRPSVDSPERPTSQAPPLDPRARVIAESLQIMSDRLNDPTISNDERLLIEAQLDMLVDLARERAARRRART